MSSQAVGVVLYEPAREKEWNAYIENSPKAVFGHDLSWKRVVEETFGHQSFYLLAYRQNQVVGILPLFLVKSLLFGRYLVTSPFLTFGGLLSDDQETAAALVNKAAEIAQETNADYIEIRNEQVYSQLRHTKNNYYTLILNLTSGEKAVWDSKLKATARRNVRKAQQGGLEVVEGHAHLDEYVRINAKNMHRLGSPAHHHRFFQNIVRFIPNALLLMARKGDTFVGGTLLVPFKDTVNMPWVGALEEYFDLRPNNLIYWEAIAHSIQRGYRFFDFGRSKFDSGTFRFKAQYGAEPIPLYYQYYLGKARQVPDVDPEAGKYRALVAVWKKLPAGLVDLLGPMIIRNIA